MLFLQYCKLKRRNEVSTKEWIGRLHIMVAKCIKKTKGQSKEPFINGNNEDVMTNKIIKE